MRTVAVLLYWEIVMILLGEQARLKVAKPEKKSEDYILATGAVLNSSRCTTPNPTNPLWANPTCPSHENLISPSSHGREKGAQCLVAKNRNGSKPHIMSV